MDSFAFLYLAILIVLVLGILLLLRGAQKDALALLAQTLYRDKDPERYLAMLGSRKLSLVLRKSTLALLRLEGHIRAGDAEGVTADEGALGKMKLKPNEKLEYCQKAMSFRLGRGEYDEGRAYLSALETLLAKEPDEKLKAILADAQLLIGIYADRDVTLTLPLEQQEATQSGGQKGLTQYRLAPAMTTGTQQPETTSEKLSISPVYGTLTTSAPNSTPTRAQCAIISGS